MEGASAAATAQEETRLDHDACCVRLPIAARPHRSLGRLTVVTGPNGSGKTSLYRSLRLLAEAAQGRLVAMLAAEGGLSSALWAGPEAIGRNEALIDALRSEDDITALRLDKDFGETVAPELEAPRWAWPKR